MDAKIKKWKLRIKEKEEEYISAFQHQGIAGLSESIVRELNAWKNETINIAVIGQSGAGKSSLINAILGLSADDSGAAEVGCTEATTLIKSYSHPNNRQFIIWDFPGVGTKTFPRESYLAQTNFGKFDFFIIAASNRFTENDVWLAHALEMMKKHYYFVRTHFADDVENEMKSKKKKSKEEVEETVKAMIMADCEKNLKEMECTNNIFILDSYERDLYDFNELQKRIINDALEISEKKQDAITLTLSAMTKPAIAEKKIILENRITSVALRAAFALRINDADVRILEEEKEFYRNQLNLDAESLDKDAKASNIQTQLSEIRAKLHTYRKTQKEAIINELDRLIPFLIPFFNIVKTYQAGKVWLKQTLDMTVEAAIEIQNTMIKGLARC